MWRVADEAGEGGCEVRLRLEADSVRDLASLAAEANHTSETAED